MLVHGVCPPDTMSCGTMIPIPKDKRKSLDCSDNYRAITLVSIVSKILDSVILLKEKSALSTSDLQFGFKKKKKNHLLLIAQVAKNMGPIWVPCGQNSPAIWVPYGLTIW